MAELNQIDAATKRYIRENPKLIDMIFQHDPTWAYLKLNAKEVYTGGRYIAEDFYYNGLIGGPYLKGKTFDITQPQVEQQLQFNVKFFEVDVTLFKEDIQVINKGTDTQIFSLVESRMNNAYMTIGAHCSLGLYLNGQAAGYTANFNGLPEILNDNGTNSWDGSTYATYGTITRGGAVGTAINSLPVNVAGTIEYDTLETEYGNASFGSGEFEPNLVVTTVLGYSYIKTKFQTQQRFNDTQDPAIGFNGLKFNAATVLKSRYVPGSFLNGAAATPDPIATTFMRQLSGNPAAVYPTITSETLWILNARKPFLNLYVSDDPEYGFGFTGFKPAQDNTIVAGQVLFAGAVTGAPRYHRQLYGITG